MDENITKRQAEIIRAVVSGYVMSGLPVGSAIIVDKLIHNVSSATVRKEMSILEQMGYLYSPHTSAGRIPTDRAVELYVKELISLYNGSVPEEVLLDDFTKTANMQLEKLLKVTAQRLASTSHNAGIVLAPLASEATINRIELVSINNNLVLMIMVSDSGSIYQKKIQLETSHGQEDLYKISRYLNTILRGHDIADIQDKGLAFFVDSDQSLGDLGNAAMKVAQNLIYTPPDQQVLIEGEATFYKHIMEQYSDLEQAEEMISHFEDKNFICDMINELKRDDRINIKVGFDINGHHISGISILSRSYSVGGRNIGALGIIGTSRMPYQRIIQNIDYTSVILSTILKEHNELDFNEDTVINIDGLPIIRT